MKIYTREADRGDGQVRLMTYGEKVKKDGQMGEALLLTTAIKFLAKDDDGRYLIAVGDIAKGEAEYKVITNKELKNKGDFAAVIRPHSILANASDYEFMLNYWMVYSKPKKLVYLKDLVGRHNDEVVDFWILDKEIIFSKVKEGGVVLRAAENQVDEMQTNNFGLSALLYERAVDFCIKDNWYWIDNAGVAGELRPMAIKGAEDKLEVKRYLEVWGKQYGNQVMNFAILGWFIACMYMDEVTVCRGLKFFPYLALTGLTQTGKTSLISNYLRFWGLEAKPTDYTQVSPFVEIKQLGQVSCMPIWRDEYRESVGHSKLKETILRSLYNMATLSKGTADQRLINYSVKTSLFLSGEDTIIDPATRRRCIYFGLADEWKLKPDQWETTTMFADNYFAHMFYLILSVGFNQAAFKEVYAYAKVNLKTINEKGEEGLCYAALASVFGVDFGKSIVDSATEYWKQEKLARPGLIKRDDLFEQFWEHAEVFFDQYGYWDVKEYFNEMQKPKVLELIWFKEKTGTFYINVKPLIRYVYAQGRLTDVTNINQQACESMLSARLKAKLGRQTIDGKQVRGFEICIAEIQAGGPLETILLNVRNTYQAYADWRRSRFKAIDDPETTPMPLLEIKQIEIHGGIQTNS